MVSHALSDDVSTRLLDATAHLLEQGGPTAANVSAIAQEAGVSRMTVYRRFGDRQELLSALFNRELGAIVAETSAVTGATERERITTSMTLAVARINEHTLMRAVLRHEPEVLTEWITGRLGATQRLAREVLRERIVAGQPGSGDGSVRPGDPAEMSLTLVLVAQTFVFSHRIGGQTDELRHLIEGYLR